MIIRLKENERMKSALETRVTKLEDKSSLGSVVLPTEIYIVGLHPDGTYGEPVLLWSATHSTSEDTKEAD